MARQTSRPDGHGRASSVSRRALLAGVGGAAALGVLGLGRRAGAQVALPPGPVSLTFWDSTSALKTKLYNELGQQMIDDLIIFPLVNPGLVLAHASDITGVRYSACCNLELGGLGIG